MAEINGLWFALATFLTDPLAAPGSVEALVLHLAQAALLAAVICLALAPPAWRKPAMVLAGVALGLICFETSFALRIVDPREWGWAMDGGDRRWHQVAWTFFRHEPWQVPPGKIANMMYPVGTSVGNADALPLAAFVFKPFDAWLPPDFQYLGLWFLVCAILRGVFAALLLNEVRAGWLYQLVGVALVVWEPGSLPSIDHAALASGSWLSLAGVWLYFRRAAPWRETCAWVVLAGVSALIHPYDCASWPGRCARRVWCAAGGPIAGRRWCTQCDG